MEKKKIIKIILIIFAIIMILFIVNIVRKVYIINKYEQQSQENVKITNFYKKSRIDDNATAEIWRKDNVSLYKRTSEDGVRMIYKNLDENIGWIIVDIKTDGIVSKSAIKMTGNELEDLMLPQSVIGGIGIENTWECIKFAFNSSITTKDYYGVKCYEIKLYKDWIEYVNKENYLCVGELNGNLNTGLIEYRFNDITDEELKLPDLSNFKITENNNK